MGKTKKEEEKKKKRQERDKFNFETTGGTKKELPRIGRGTSQNLVD